LKKKASFTNILAHHHEVVVPEIHIKEKEKLSILDKVLISAFSPIEFPFLQRVTTDETN